MSKAHRCGRAVLHRPHLPVRVGRFEFNQHLPRKKSRRDVPAGHLDTLREFQATRELQCSRVAAEDDDKGEWTDGFANCGDDSAAGTAGTGDVSGGRALRAVSE